MSFFRNNNPDQPTANNQNQSNYEVNSQQGKKEGRRWWRVTDSNEPIDQPSANNQTHSTQVVRPVAITQIQPRQDLTKQPIANNQTKPNQRAKRKSNPNGLCIPLERIYQTILELKIKASADKEKRDVTVEEVAGQLGVTRDALQKVLKRNHNITYTQLKALSIEKLRQIPYYNQIHPSFKKTSETIKLSLQDIHNAFARQETALLYQKNVPKAAEILSQQYSTEISPRVVRNFLKEKFPFLLIKFDLFLSSAALKQKVDAKLGTNKYEEKHEIVMYRKLNRQNKEPEEDDIVEVELAESITTSIEPELDKQPNLDQQAYQQFIQELASLEEPSSQLYLGQQLNIPQSYLGQQPYQHQQSYLQPQQPQYLQQQYLQQQYLQQPQTTSYAPPIITTIENNTQQQPTPNTPNDTTHLKITVRQLHPLTYGKKSLRNAARNLGLQEEDLREQLHLKKIDNADMLSTLAVNAEIRLGSVFDEEITIKRSHKRQLTEATNLGSGLSTDNTNKTSTTSSRKTNKQKKQKKERPEVTVIDYNDTTQNDDVIATTQSNANLASQSNSNTPVNISAEEVDNAVKKLLPEQFVTKPNLVQDFNSETLDFMRFFQSPETQSNVSHIHETLEFHDQNVGPK